MPRSPKLNQSQKSLIRRYLVWCYKTTKEDLDRIDRYFTQFEADCYMLKTLTQTKAYKSSPKNDTYRTCVDDFKKYLELKKNKALKQKFKDPKLSVLQPHYQYLRARVTAIEKAIRHFLSRKDLRQIQKMYEEEMTQRILTAREHSKG